MKYLILLPLLFSLNVLATNEIKFKPIYKSKTPPTKEITKACEMRKVHREMNEFEAVEVRNHTEKIYFIIEDGIKNRKLTYKKISDLNNKLSKKISSKKKFLHKCMSFFWDKRFFYSDISKTLSGIPASFLERSKSSDNEIRIERLEKKVKYLTKQLSKRKPASR